MAPTEEARIAEVQSKVVESVETASVPWQNTHRVLKVIVISLDSVLLNPASHRIKSQIESHPDSALIESNPFSDRSQQLIEKILSETSGFEALHANLKEYGQVDPGIISHTGVLVNANTRAVALRKLREEYIRVAVLPASATSREITELEARLQLSRDFRQDYSLTNELLFIKDQIDSGKPLSELALLLGKAPSSSKAHLKRGVEEIEKSLRILQHIREVQHLSEGHLPLTFFDAHESALSEADAAYVAARVRDAHEADRVRNGRMLGILTGVTYRNLRNWDSDTFLERYVDPQFEDSDGLSQLMPSSEATDDASDQVDDGLSVLDEAASSSAPEGMTDLGSLLSVVARTHAEEPLSEIAPGRTREAVIADIAARITQAAEEKEQDRREERRATTPITLVRDARTRIVRATEALKAARLEPDFNPGKLRYELRRLRKAIDTFDGDVGSDA